MIGLLLTAFWFIWVISLRDKLNKEYLVTQGIITDCHWGGRGSAFYIAEFNFSINSKTYSSSYPLKCKEFGSDTLQKRLVGLHVPVVYSPENPWINTIAIERETFKQYDLPIPDSLIAIINFLDCK